MWWARTIVRFLGSYECAHCAAGRAYIHGMQARHLALQWAARLQARVSVHQRDCMRCREGSACMLNSGQEAVPARECITRVRPPSAWCKHAALPVADMALHLDRRIVQSATYMLANGHPEPPLVSHVVAALRLQRARAWPQVSGGGGKGGGGEHQKAPHGLLHAARHLEAHPLLLRGQRALEGALAGVPTPPAPVHRP